MVSWKLSAFIDFHFHQSWNPSNIFNNIFLVNYFLIQKLHLSEFILTANSSKIVPVFMGDS